MKEYFENEEGVVALILGDSVAKNEARSYSDLDGMVIFSDSAYEKRAAEGKPLAECVFGRCAYPEGYFDVKYFTKKYLEEAAERGSDPTRNSFVDCKNIFSNDNEIEKLIERIRIYPKDKKTERIKLFHSVLRLSSGYFFNDALASGDPYMLCKCCFEIVYAGLRMLYALNEEFFPSHKKLIEYSERLARKPEGLTSMARTLCEKKDAASRDAFVGAVIGFADWGSDLEAGCGWTYVEKMEQSWRNSEDNVYEI